MSADSAEENGSHTRRVGSDRLNLLSMFIPNLYLLTEKMGGYPIKSSTDSSSHEVRLTFQYFTSYFCYSAHISKK